MVFVSYYFIWEGKKSMYSFCILFWCLLFFNGCMICLLMHKKTIPFHQHWNVGQVHHELLIVNSFIILNFCQRRHICLIWWWSLKPFNQPVVNLSFTLLFHWHGFVHRNWAVTCNIWAEMGILFSCCCKNHKNYGLFELSIFHWFRGFNACEMSRLINFSIIGLAFLMLNIVVLLCKLCRIFTII